MIKTVFSLSLSATILSGALVGCSASTPRINPGHLQVSERVNTYTATIANVVQLSEKEVSLGKEILGGLTGAIIGSTISTGSDTGDTIVTDLGGDIGEDAVREKYGTTIYRLTLKLPDGSAKQVHVRGGTYLVGDKVRITIDKKRGTVTSMIKQ